MSKTSIKLSVDDVAFFANLLGEAERAGISLEEARAHFMNIIGRESDIRKLQEKEQKKGVKESHPSRPEFG